MKSPSALRPVAASLCVALLAALSAGLPGCSATATDDPAGSEDAISKKPPQYVLLAFDGSYSNSFWAESREFAQEAKRKGAPLKFTYFINAAYYLPKAAGASYAPPQHARGASAIGWGGTDADVAKRIEQTNLAFQEGHEIGSHTVGHWDGSTWSAAEWESEFSQWDKLLFETPHPGAPPFAFTAKDSVGFRAPQLGHSPGLYPTLREHGYTYDTSKSAASSHWPEKVNGVWDMALAQLRIVGSSKRTLSMDYNFYVADSAAAPDAGNFATYKKRMLDTYRAYFNANYTGNRAPVHIGHHFSKWNGGAYWEAMKEFALEVCAKPNVKCTTYKDLVTFLNARTPQELADYKSAAFYPEGDTDNADGAFVGDVSGAHDEAPPTP
jgi:peptidoglycan/xylan/chitin deacetylase (PgdA/CDA1 family)